MIPLFDRAGKRQHWPIVTWLLLVLNCVVFAYELSLPPAALACVIGDYSVIPHYLAMFSSQPPVPGAICASYSPPEPAIMPMFSALFLHAGWLHIIGNMLFLLIFGDNVEDRLGHIGFLILYLFAGLAGAAAQTLVDPSSTTPILGASGAVAGVLAAYLVLFPRVRVRTLLLVILVDIPAWLLIGLWIGFQALNGLAVFGATAQAATGVAYFAHLGGFAFGLFLGLFHRWFGPAPTPSGRAAATAPKSTSE